MCRFSNSGLTIQSLNGCLECRLKKEIKMKNIYIILILFFSFTIISCAKKSDTSSTNSTTEVEGTTSDVKVPATPVTPSSVAYKDCTSPIE